MRPKNIGRQIRSRRRAFGISQTMVAEAVGHHYSWLGLVERGRLAIGDADAARVLEAIDRIAREILRAAKEPFPCAQISFDDLKLRDRRRKTASGRK